MNKQTLYNYGNKEISELSNYYISSFPEEYKDNLDLIIFEWKKLKEKLASELKNNIIHKDNIISYILVDPYFEISFEGIRELVSIYAVLPCSKLKLSEVFQL